MNSNTTYLLFFLFSPYLAVAQGENNHWVFGNAAHFNFESGSPEYVIGRPNMNTQEGSTSVSDSKGNLLFYSDGLAVYGRDHNMLPNGDGLRGNKSSTSSAVAVPFPGNPNRYYLFCVDYNLSEENKGLSYNIIDMSLNEGKGAVVVKNRLLVKPCDEKIAVTRNCDSKGFWVVVHEAFTDRYLSYAIGDTGLNINPVISIIKSHVGERPEIGYLKFSPGGKWLVNACTLEENLQLFGFDKRSGKLSLKAFDNYRYHRNNRPNAQTYYGVAFSENERYLYVSTLEDGEIFQFDLSLPPVNILKNRYLIHNLDRFSGALQMAADKKIYVANGYESSYLHCILYPNLPESSCGFKKYHLYLGSLAKANIGLPTMIETSIYYNNLGRDIIVHNTDNFKLDAGIESGKYLWSTGETTKTIKISDTGGVYWVKVFDPNACMYYSDTIRVMVYKNFSVGISGIENKEFCSNTVSSPIVFESSEKDVSFIWLCNNSIIGLRESGRGSIPQFKIPFTSDSRYAKIKVYPVRNGFIGNPDSFYIKINPSPIIDQYNVHEYEYCSGDNVNDLIFKAKKNPGTVKWYNDNPETGIPDSGIFMIRSFTARAGNTEQISRIKLQMFHGSCPSEEASFNIRVNPVPVIFPIKDIDICSGQNFPDPQLKSNVDGCVFKVQNPLFPSKQIELPRNFLKFLKIPANNHLFEEDITVFPVYKTCTGKPDTFNLRIKPSPKAEFTISETLSDTAYFTTVVNLNNTSLAYNRFYWQFNSETDSVNEQLSLQIYTNSEFPISLTVGNIYNCFDAREERLLFSRYPMVFVPNTFSPNGDERNDNLVCRAYGIRTWHIMIMNRWGEKVYAGTEKSMAWDGSMDEKPCPDGVYTWLLEGVDLNGKIFRLSGTITLNR